MNLAVRLADRSRSRLVKVEQGSAMSEFCKNFSNPLDLFLNRKYYSAIFSTRST